MARNVSLFLAFAFAAAMQGQSAPHSASDLVVGKAEAMNVIRSTALKQGDSFFLRTIETWQQGDCTLPLHTTVTGQITAAASTGNSGRGSTLGVRFAPIPCSGSETALMMPLLVAVQVIDDTQRRDLQHFSTARAQSPSLAGVFPPSPSGQAATVPKSGNNMMTSAYVGSVLNNLRTPVPEKPLKTGEVRGIRGLALELPGRDGTTTLSSSHKIVFDRDTQFALAFVPAIVERRPVAAPAPVPSAPSAPVASTDVPSESPAAIEEVCASSGCTQLAPIANSSSAQAVWTLPLAGLGYQPRPQQQIVGLDDSASVHFLGEDQLLLTFTLHTLTQRPAVADQWGSGPRNVRGVLISRADGRILRIKDWTVPDSGPFVWASGDGRVLARVGHNLVAFGPDLVTQQQAVLPGPLFFLSAAPHGELFLVATVHERHTRQEHASIATFVGPSTSVDEDYDLTGLNAALQVTGTKRVSVEPVRPALLQSSLISAEPAHRTEWLIEQRTWEGDGKPIALLHSACEVEVASLPGDLLLAQGCVPTDASVAWFRVLNSAGATVLKRTFSYGEFVQQAQSDQSGTRFAVASSNFAQPVSRTSPLHAADFTNLTVTVYDTATGRQSFVTRLSHGSAQQDTFSLSPSGSSLAVLTSESLQSFSLSANPARP